MKNVICYTPELDEKFPEAVCGNITIGHYGGWYLSTPLTLKGRGIRFLKTYQSNDLVPQAQYKVGWNQYRLTDRALEQLPYRFACEVLLD